MTKQQPEALRLADVVERLNIGVHSQAIAEEYSAAARELRRLHAKSELHLQELRSYRITVENRDARIVELEAQLAAAQQGVLPNDKGLRDKVARALGCGTGTNYAWSYLLKQIECLVECEEELIALKESTRSHPQGLEQSVQKVVQDWQRQKNLFPQLHKDGWMDLALSELAAQAKHGGV